MTTPSSVEKELIEIAEKMKSGTATPEEVFKLTREVNALLTALNDVLQAAKK